MLSARFNLVEQTRRGAAGAGTVLEHAKWTFCNRVRLLVLFSHARDWCSFRSLAEVLDSCRHVVVVSVPADYLPLVAELQASSLSKVSASEHAPVILNV